MAKVDLNLAYDALLGDKSEYVYRRRNGKMYFTRRPDPDLVSPAQEQIRNRFLFAASYANGVLADPLRRAEYEALNLGQNKPLREVIMTDYLRSPRVVAIGLEGFNRSQDSQILVLATKEGGAVTGVQVTVRAADDTLLEEGEAVSQPEGWMYAATGTYPEGNPITITATAVDRFGHKASKTVAWP